MKKRILVTLLAAITVCGVITLNGCTLNPSEILEKISTDTTTDNTDLSVEPEQHGDVNGSITLHTRWYDTDDTKLGMAGISVTSADETIYGGATDENGRLDTFSVPSNKELTITATNSSGQTIGVANVICHLSYDYDAYKIYPVHATIGESDASDDSSAPAEAPVTASGTIEIEVPAKSADVSVALFVTNNGAISFANMAPYTETTSIEEEAATAEDISGEITGEEGNAEEGGTEEAEAPAASEGNAYANQGDINVRSNPVDGDMVGYLVENQTVDILDSTEGADGNTWYQIGFTQDGGDFTGWVRSDFVTEGTAPGDPIYPAAE